MDPFVFDHHSDVNNHENIFLEMMKQHLSNGLTFQSTQNYVDASLQSTSDGETSSQIDNDLDENESLTAPVVYKKRARIKFTQEQLDILETTFQQHRYPTIDMIDDLVEQLNLPTQKITVWFQNRRARLKKSQQKVDEHHSVERDDHQRQYDSGINLDDDASRASSTSPSCYTYPTTNYVPSESSAMTYYLPTTHQQLYNPMWHNFHYPSPFPSAQSFNQHLPYHFMNYNSPFTFQDRNNYSIGTDYYNQ